jgi:hypothetical protein
MTVVPPQQVQITCPNCGRPYRTAIFSLIDVGQQPDLKTPFLLGQLNTAVCPNCGAALPLATDTVYHDPAKQLLLVYSPQGQGARPQEQERFVGELTNFVLRTLPPDAPKGYVLAPRRFMSLQSLVDAILEADGVTREQFEGQLQKVNLVYILASVIDDEQQFNAAVAEYRDVVDDDLFALLDAYIDAGERAGRPDAVAPLITVRDRLRVLVAEGLPEPEASGADLDALVEQLTAASDEELPTLVRTVRGDLDYDFFAALTERIEALRVAGDAAGADQLLARRQQILEVVEAFDREEQQRFEETSTLLRAVYEAQDRLAALRERSADLRRLAEPFFFLLEANAEAAERAGNAAVVAEMAALREHAQHVIDESLSPEDRFINQLLQSETPQDSTRLLRQHAAQVTPTFVKRLNELADELGSKGQQEQGDQVRRLAREAGAMLF